MLHKDLKSIFVQFTQFGLVGLSNTVISYLIYSSLVYLGLYYIFASIIAFVISVLNSFYWNNKYVFKRNRRGSMIKALCKTFVSYSVTGLFLGNIMLFILVDVLHISKYLAPFFGLPITVPLNFILNKFWTFRAEIKKENRE